MAERRIEITIEQDGKINAKTEGFKGPVCLDALQELLGDIADLESYDKTDEWYQAINNSLANTETVKRG